jgi:hypothetical protein
MNGTFARRTAPAAGQTNTFQRSEFFKYTVWRSQVASKYSYYARRIDFDPNRAFKLSGRVKLSLWSGTGQTRALTTSRRHRSSCQFCSVFVAYFYDDLYLTLNFYLVKKCGWDFGAPASLESERCKLAAE